jgi:predicted nucleic acid-binding protein
MRSRRRPRAVVDTNLLVSSVLSNLGLPYQLFLKFVDDFFILLISNELRDELEEVLQREHLQQFGLTPQSRDDLLYLVDTKGYLCQASR